jgi:predicted dienelactone hydrolase
MSNLEALETPAAVFTVGVTTQRFFDASRMRAQKVTLWYPADHDKSAARGSYGMVFVRNAHKDASYLAAERKRPLLLLSHGFAGTALNLAWLAEALARQGYIVAGVDHVLNKWDNSGHLDIQLRDRPMDLSFSLTQLLQDATWAARIDADIIGAAGHSFGGYTVLALAGARYSPSLMRGYFSDHERTTEREMLRSLCALQVDTTADDYGLSDPRIKAVHAMAPGIGPGIELDSLQAIRVPVLISATADDEILSCALNAEHYAKYIPGCRFKRMPSGGHYAFNGECTDLAKWFSRFAKPDYCGIHQGISRATLHAGVIRDSLEFFAEAL